MSEAKAGTLNAAVESKRASLAPATTMKQRAIYQSLPSSSPAPIQDDQLNQFTGLDDYREKVGIPSSKAIEFFALRKLRNRQAEFDGIMQETEAREKRAWADDDNSNALNDAARFYKTVSRFGGELLAGPVTGYSFVKGLSVGDERTDIFNRERNDIEKQKNLNVYEDSLREKVTAGTIPENEANLLYAGVQAQRNKSADTVTLAERAKLDERSDAGGGRTYREMAQEAYTSQEVAEKIRSTFDTSRFVNETYGKDLEGNLSKTYQENLPHFENVSTAYENKDFEGVLSESIVGVAGLIAGGGADLVNDPRASFSYVIENLPYVLGGAVSKAALKVINIAYGVDIYSSAIEHYQDENEGAFPPSKERAAMIAISLTASWAEQIGTMGIVNRVKGIPVIKKALEGPVGKTMDTTLRKVTASRLLDNGIVNTAKAGVGAAVPESMTEMWQTMVEENFSRLNADIDGEHVFKAGVLGAAAGGQTAAIGRGVNEAGTGLLKAVSNAPKISSKDRLSNEARDEAVKTGDVSTLLDPESKAYSPAKAAAALLQRSQESESKEERATNLAKVEELTNVERMKLELTQETYLAQVEKTGKDSKQAKKSGKVMNAQLKVVEAMEHALERNEQNELDKNGLAEMWKSVNSVEESPEKDKAARELIGLAMKSPKVFMGFLGKDEETVAQNIKGLTENTSFSEEEKTYLNNFSAAHAALNAAKTSNEVQENVIDGAPGFRGVAEFRTGIAAAIKEGAKSTANKFMAKLEGFSVDHLKKQAAHEEGLALLQEELAKPEKQRNKSLIYLVKPRKGSNGEWEITRTKPKEWNRRENGGWEINISDVASDGKDTSVEALDKKINAMQVENTLLSTTAAELNSAVSLGFTSTASNTKTDTPVTASAEEVELTEGAPVSADAAPVAPVESDGASIDADLAAEENTAAPLPDLIAALGSAQEVGAEYDMWNSDATDPKVKADLEAETAAYEALETGVARVIERIQSFGTESAKKLKAKEKEVRGQSEKDNAELVALANAALKYEKEYNAAQSQLDFSNENQGDNDAELQQAEETKSKTPEEIANTSTPISESADVGAIKQILRDNNWVNEDGTLKPSNSRNMPEVIEGVFIDSPSKLLAEAKNQLINEASNETESKTAEEAQEVSDLTQESANPYSVESIKAMYKKEGIVNADGTLRKLGVQEMSKELEDIRMEAPLENLEQVKAELLAEAAEEATAGPQAEAVDSVDETKTTQPNTQTAKEIAKKAEQDSQDESYANDLSRDASNGSKEDNDADIQQAYKDQNNQTDKESNDKTASQSGNETENRTQEGDAEQESDTNEQSNDAKTDNSNESPEVEIIDGNFLTAEDQLDRTLNKDELKLVDKLKVYFSQRTEKENDSTQNPLIAVQDFLGLLFSDGKLNRTLLEMFLEDGDLNSAQLNVIMAFADFRNNFIGEKILANINTRKTKKHDEFRHRDPIQFLRDDMPENVITAMAFAAFSWIADNGGQLHNDERAMKGIFGLNASEKLDQDQIKFGLYAGTRESLIMQELGNRTLKALGLRANKGAPANEEVQVALSLGAHTLIALLQPAVTGDTKSTPWLVRKVSYDAVLNRKDEDNLESENFGHPFITINQTEENNLRKPNSKIELIMEQVKGTKNVLNKLFGVSSSKVAPTLDPEDYKQEDIRRSRGKVPSFMKRVLNYVGKRKYRSRMDVQNVRSAIDRTIMLGILGKSKAGQYTQTNLKEATQSADDGVERQLNDIEDFELALREAKEKFFYFLHSMVSTQRVRLAQNLVNPQDSKIHRAFIVMDEFKATVDPSSSDKNTKLFKLSVAQGLGISVDKMLNSESMKEFEALVEREDFKQVIAIIQNILNGGTPSVVEQKAIATLIAETGEKAHSLAVLVDWAQYRTAEANGTSFDTYIMYEVDGVTNGPAIAHFQLGLGAGIANMVGVYKANDPAQSFAQHKDLGLRDMYESLSWHVNEKVTSAGHKLTEAVHYITGPMVEGESQNVSKEGRDLVKTPLTSLLFGSGVKKVAKNMSIDFAHSFFVKLQKAANKGDDVTVLNSVKAINVILAARKVKQLPLPKNFDEAMALKFTFEQKEAVEAAFHRVVGVHVESTLKKYFSELIESRNKINEASQALHTRHQVVVEFLTTKAIERKIKEGSVAQFDVAKRVRNQRGKMEPGTPDLRPEQYLSADEIQEIYDEAWGMIPFVHTAASKIDGDISTGMDISKVSQTTVTADDKNRSRSHSITAKSAVPFLDEDERRTGPKDQLSPKGMYERASDPGVRALVVLTHAFDSLVAAKAYFEVAGLNLYDALSMGLSQAVDGAIALNKHFFQQMIQYSIPTEIHAALVRSFEAETALVEKHPELGALLKNVNVGFNNDVLIDQEFLDSLGSFALEAEKQKLLDLKEYYIIDQYAMEGGSYKVTDADRALIDERLAEIDAILLQLSNSIQKSIEDVIEKIPTKEETAPISSKPNVAESIPAEVTPWGELNVGIFPTGEPRVAAFFNGLEEEVTDTDTMLAALEKIIAENIKEGASQKDQLALLRSLRAAINKNIPIYIVNSETETNYFPGLDAVQEQGWLMNSKGEESLGLYTTIDGKEAIWIKSDDYTHSGFHVETLLHEVVHAVVVEMVNKYENVGINQIPAAERSAFLAVKNLKNLHQKAKQMVNGNSELKAKYGAAVENVNETIAWGMTNRGFQREVLNKIQMPVSENSKSTLQESGFKHFINNIANMLFGKPTDADRNAIGVLLTNTGILFSEARSKEAAAQADFGFPMKQANTVMSFTTAETFDALDGNTDGSIGFTRHLKSLLSSVTERAYAGGVLKAAAEKLAVVEAEDVFLKSLDTGEAPFASLLQHRLSMSDQEAFVAESLEVALADLMAQPESSLRKNELNRIYVQAKKRIKKEDLPPGAWELLFNPATKPSGRSDFLSQFAAAALAYKPLYDKLTEIGLEGDTREFEGNLVERLMLLVSKLLNSLAQWNAGTRKGDSLSTSIKKLAEKMATIEADRKAAIIKRNTKPASWLNSAQKKSADALKEGVKAAANSAFIKNNSVQAIKVGAGLAKLGVEDKLGDFTDFFIKISNVASDGRLGLPGEMINEIRNGRDGQIAQNTLLDQMNHHEQVRKQASDETIQDAIKSFIRKITREEGEALTSIIMRAELSSLKGYTMAEIDRLLSDRNFLEKAIRGAEKKIKGKNRRYYLAQAKALGQNLMTGKNESKHLMLNAHSIAHLSGTKTAINEAEANEAMANIDPLITLYALRDSDKTQRTMALNVLREEAAREDGNNGFERMIKMHAYFQEQAKESIFKGSELQMRKGYVNETFNPNVKIIATTLKMGKELEQSGYKRLYPEKGPIPRDPNDISAEDRYLYVVTGQGLGRHVTGHMSNSDKAHEGFVVDGEIEILSTGKINHRNKAINDAAKARREAGIAELFTRDENWRPGQGGPNYMAPILNPKGEVVNYRYLMEEETKKVALERRNEIEKVMGNIASSIIDKVGSPELNENSVDAFKAEYDKNYLMNQEAYIVMSANSSDPVIAERYRLLPKATQAYIRKVWGRNGMLIRKDAYLIAFGYRKFSLGDAFEKDKKTRNFMENILVGVLGQIEIVEGEGKNKRITYMPSSKARWLIRGENAWQEIVKIVKDIVVIKNVFTLLGNQMSNMSILALAGVPLVTIVKHTFTGIMGAHKFRKDAIQRNKLRKAITIDALTGDVLQAAQDRIIELEEAMATNPVKELIDAGMYQTLVEDLSQEEDPYTYKSKFMESAGKAVKLLTSPLAVIPGASKVGKGATTVINNLFLTHDTAAYKFLNRATVMSDFSSRYVLYKHLTERRVDPLSKEDSLHRARQTFVNYDVPTHQALQYLNDTGFLWFTKYYLRIQAVITQLVRENPLRVLALIGANNLLFPIADILDSSALTKWPVNFGWGAGEIVNVLDEIAPINAALSLID